MLSDFGFRTSPIRKTVRTAPRLAQLILGHRGRALVHRVEGAHLGRNSLRVAPFGIVGATKPVL